MTQTPTAPPQHRVYMLSQVAAILSIPATQVKNWTIGRPLTITPNLRAQGTGSRNLYGDDDLYKFAIAAQLYADGLTARTIQSVLDTAGTQLGALGFVIVKSKSGSGKAATAANNPEVLLVPAQRGKIDSNAVLHRMGRTGGHVLNVSAIKQETDRRVAEFWANCSQPKEATETPSDAADFQKFGNPWQATRKFKWVK
jgi:hypothetical protein